jgi:hypothetical protein
MPLILGANSLTGGYEIDNSLGFNDGSSDNLTEHQEVQVIEKLGHFQLGSKSYLVVVVILFFQVIQTQIIGQIFIFQELIILNLLVMLLLIYFILHLLKDLEIIQLGII